MFAESIAADEPARVVGLFAKWPSPGTVKTRLAAATTPAWAARVADACLRDTLLRLGRLPVRRVIAFTPLEAEADFARLAGPDVALVPQGNGDLGQRMSRFIEQQLREGADAVVLVGADSPTLPTTHIEQTFAELKRADLVLGPAMDGGYYLVGCGRRVPPIFEGIAWSTGQVLAQTLACLGQPGSESSEWRLALLPPWYDIDTREDWALLRTHITAMRRAGIDPDVPHIEGLLVGRQL
jgi:uncharacterized protein